MTWNGLLWRMAWFVGIGSAALFAALPQDRPETRRSAESEPVPVVTNQEALDELVAAEAAVQDLDRSAEVAARLPILEVRSRTMGYDYRARVRNLLVTLDHIRELRLAAGRAEDARARWMQHRTDSGLREALLANDGARAQFDRAFPVWTGVASTRLVLSGLVDASDDLVRALITQEYEASVEPIDLLSPKSTRFWGASTDGIRYRLENHRLVAEGIETPGKKLVGIVSAIPPVAEMWADVVLDITFEVTAGKRGSMLLRYLPGKTPYEFSFAMDSGAGLKLGVPIHAVWAIVGGTFAIRSPGDQHGDGKLSLNVSRAGGLGFAVHPGTTIEVSRCMLKVLRRVDYHP